MRKLRHEEIPRADPAEIGSLPRHPVMAVLENIRSIHNVGSMFRTSDAAAIEKVFLTGFTGTPEHRGIHKSALGAQETVPWEQVPDVHALCSKLRSAGATIASLEITDTPTYASDLTLANFPLCLVVGNELGGVSEEALELSDIALEIPQYGSKQSLNVSVAFGIAVFDIVRRYRHLRLRGS